MRITDLNRIDLNRLLLLAAVLVFIAGVALVSVQRTGLGMGIETDFVGTFAPEAKRILDGEPLKLLYHPPGYAFVLATVKSIADDWLTAGLVISAIAATLTVLASAWTVGRLFGTAASWGALAAVYCSTLFWRFSSLATSDMAFAALVALTLAFLVAGMTGPIRPWRWMATGLLAGLAILERTNGIALVAIVAAPLLLPLPNTRRLRLSGIIVVGLAVPLLAWCLYAGFSDSPFSTTKGYVNLAVAAYSQERGSTGEELQTAGKQFGSMRDVVMHDPVAMLNSFVRRLLALPKKLVTGLTWPPIAVAAIAGFLVVIWRDRSKATLTYFGTLAALTCLTGIKAFEPRLHLILVPFLGGLAAYAVASLIDRSGIRGTTRLIVWAGLSLALIPLAASAYRKVLPTLETPVQVELREATRIVLDRIEGNAVIYARKEHLGFFTGRSISWIPDEASLDALRVALCAELDPGQPNYLYFGSAERQYRPQLATELKTGPTPTWLEPVAFGTSPEWTLYRILLRSNETANGDKCEA